MSRTTGFSPGSSTGPAPSSDPCPLDWAHAVADVPRSPRTSTRVATAEERAAVAAALDLPAVAALEAAYALTATASNAFALDGTLRARVTQTCVVTLEPVDATYDLPLAAEFRADADAAARAAGPSTGEAGDEAEILSLPDVEPIEHGQLAIGRVVFETLGAGLDAHPRRADAVLDWQEPPERDLSPFAVLAGLKREG